MANIEPSGKAAEPRALTDFPPVAGVISPEQEQHLTVIAEKIPHWLCWHRLCGDDPKRLGKAPLNPKKVKREGIKPGQVSGVSAANPETASTLEFALALIPVVDGVGCTLFTADADVVILDLDHVRDAVTGELNCVGIWALQHLQGSYVEISPSGTGLRAAITGSVPFEGKKFYPLDAGGNRFLGPDGEETAIEIFRAGKGLYTRMTGALVRGVGVAQWVGCQPAIDWVGNLLVASKSHGKGVVGGGPSSASGGKLSLGQVFAQVGELRGTPDKEGDSITVEIIAKVASQPRGKLANAWNGKGDKSHADHAVCCEAVRRGAGSFETVCAVWGAAPAGKREKFDRADYQRSTVESAARYVLEELQGKASKSASVVAERKAKAAEVSGATGFEVQVSGTGKIASSFSMIVAMLRAKAPGSFAYDEFQKTVLRRVSMRKFDEKGTEKLGRVTDDDYGRVALWLSRDFGIEVKDLKLIKEAVSLVARDSRYDPVAETFRELAREWAALKKVSLLDSWLTKYAKVEDYGIEKYVKKVGRCALIQAVRRVLIEGSEVHAMPILIANGGDNKGHLLKALADAIGPGLYQNQRFDLGKARNVIETAGRSLIVEWADMSAISDVGAFKAAMTQQVDTDRKSYGYESEDHIRRFTVWGTANETELITDPTEGQARRVWPLYLKRREKADIEGFRGVARMLWGEAAWVALNSDERHFIDEADVEIWEQRNAVIKKCRVSDPVEEALDAYLDEWAKSTRNAGGLVTSNDIAKAVGLVDPYTQKPENGNFKTLSKLLTARDMVTGQDDRKHKAWLMPEDVRARLLKAAKPRARGK